MLHAKLSKAEETKNSVNGAYLTQIKELSGALAGTKAALSEARP